MLERQDSEDLNTLAQMIQLGTEYICEQDEPGEQANIPKMEAIIQSVAELVPFELQESEPTEDE